ncbi:MAG: hypothetical protein KOO66_12975 [Bacteroidales bacterium]|nr:hypothetical protein [Bacteroidales bacterium]
MCQDKVLIETIGYIKKEANLSTLEGYIIPNTLVLESLHPYPDYHGKNLPEKSKPRSLFLIVNKDYSYEEIARVTKKIKQEFEFDFNASQGNIYFKTTSYPCIRIKYLKSFTFLPELQGLFQEYGIKFAKQKMINSKGIIIINKHFFVSESGEGLYNDLEEDSKFYIELPKDLPWDEFKEFTQSIKNNIDNSDFDAAQGVFYRKEGIIEVVRLYICEGDTGKVKNIHKLYIDKIQKKYK